jgi:hypothetical protein
MRTMTAMVMLFGMSGAARAEWTFTLDPPQGQEGQNVSLRIDNQPVGCTLFGMPTSMVRDGNTVRVSFEVDDGILPPPCLPERVAPRLQPLGSFAAGNYTVEVSICVNAPVPPFCSVHTTLELSVFGSTGQRFTVPALSAVAAICLVFLMMAVAALGARRN